MDSATPLRRRVAGELGHQWVRRAEPDCGHIPIWWGHLPTDATQSPAPFVSMGPRSLRRLLVPPAAPLAASTNRRTRNPAPARSRSEFSGSGALTQRGTQNDPYFFSAAMSFTSSSVCPSLSWTVFDVPSSGWSGEKRSTWMCCLPARTKRSSNVPSALVFVVGR